MTAAEKVERRRDDIAWAILSGLIARGEVLSDPFGKLIGEKADANDLRVPPEAGKRMVLATAVALGFANDLVKLVGPPPRAGRRNPKTGRAWHPAADMKGVQSVTVERVGDGSEIAVKVAVDPGFLDGPGHEERRQTILDWLTQDCGLPVAGLKWRTSMSGEGG